MATGRKTAAGEQDPYRGELEKLARKVSDAEKALVDLKTTNDEQDRKLGDLARDNEALRYEIERFRRDEIPTGRGEPTAPYSMAFAPRMIPHINDPSREMFGLYAIDSTAQTVMVYGASGLGVTFEDFTPSSGSGGPFTYRGVHQAVTNGSTGKTTDVALDVSTYPYIYLKVVLDNSTTPAFPAVVTLEQGSSGFPKVSNGVTFYVPLWYVGSTDNAIDPTKIVRGISSKQLSQIS